MLLSGSDQHGHRPQPVAQDTHRSRDEATQTAVVPGLWLIVLLLLRSNSGAEQLQTNNILPTLTPSDVRCFLPQPASRLMCSFSQTMHTSLRPLLFSQFQNYLQTVW